MTEYPTWYLCPHIWVTTGEPDSAGQCLAHCIRCGAVAWPQAQRYSYVPPSEPRP